LLKFIIIVESFASGQHFTAFLLQHGCILCSVSVLQKKLMAFGFL